MSVRRTVSRLTGPSSHPFSTPRVTKRSESRRTARAGASGRRLRAGQRHKVRLGHAVNFGRASGHVFAYPERFIEALFAKAPADARDSRCAAAERVGDFLVGPGRALEWVFIGEQKDTCVLDEASVARAGARELVEALSLLVGEADRMLRWHSRR